MRIRAMLLVVMPIAVAYGAVCGGLLAGGFVWQAVRRPRSQP